MAERFSKPEGQESSKEKAFEKAERMKENLMKLEKSVIDEVDEATQSARGAIHAMGFGITPIMQTDNENEDE
jgi:hypothetical protein